MDRLHFGKEWETNLLCAVLTHTVLPPCLRLTGFRGSDFPLVFSLSSTTVGFVILTKATIIPTSKCIYKYSVCWCNWHKTQTALGCPASPFTLQHFKLLQAELPETVVNSWHWEFPWSQLACKKGCLFFPLKIVYFLGTVQMPQMKQMKDLFWPTCERLSPPS